MFVVFFLLYLIYQKYLDFMKRLELKTHRFVYERTEGQLACVIEQKHKKVKGCGDNDPCISNKTETMLQT